MDGDYICMNGDMQRAPSFLVHCWSLIRILIVINETTSVFMERTLYGRFTEVSATTEKQTKHSAKKTRLSFIQNQYSDCNHRNRRRHSYNINTINSTHLINQRSTTIYSCSLFADELC